MLYDFIFRARTAPPAAPAQGRLPFKMRNTRLEQFRSTDHPRADLKITEAKRTLIHDHVNSCLDVVANGGSSKPTKTVLAEFKAISRNL